MVLVLHLSKLLAELISFASCSFPCFVIARVKETMTPVTLYQAKKFQFLLFKYCS